MLENGFGRIINVSSLSVKEPIQNLVLSNAIRASLITWSKTLATEVAKNNVTVNNILTGYFDTERMNSLIDSLAKGMNSSIEAVKKSFIDQIPMKRFGKPEEYGFLVAFLASDFAKYITGTSIPIDGGLIKSI